MAGLLKNLGAITLFVEDLDAAKAFYGEALGLSKVYEDDVSAVFDIGNTIINLLAIAEAPNLIAPANVAQKEAGARAQLTIWVDDTNAICAELKERGVALLNGPIDRAWGMRTACIMDPAGHVWEFAQNLNAGATA